MCVYGYDDLEIFGLQAVHGLTAELRIGHAFARFDRVLNDGRRAADGGKVHGAVPAGARLPLPIMTVQPAAMRAGAYASMRAEVVGPQLPMISPGSAGVGPQ